MAHDAHIRRDEVARHVAMLRQADADALAALRDQLSTRCYPPPAAGARLNPRAIVPFDDDRVLTALCTRLWPSAESQDQ